MTIEEQLKSEILKKYKSVAAFTSEIGIPNSTLNSVFKRGIANAGINTMIKVFDALDLDIESVTDGELRPRPPEYKKSPSAAEAAPGEEELKLMEYLKRGVYDMGFLPAGAALTDRQAEALLGVCAILHAIFDE